MASQNDLRALRLEIDALMLRVQQIVDSKEDPSLSAEYENLLQSKQNLLAFLAQNGVAP